MIKYYIVKKSVGNYRTGDIITALESEYDNEKVLPLTGDVIPKSSLREVFER